MVLFLQYNLNIHILDSVCIDSTGCIVPSTIYDYLWWPNVFPGGEFMSLLTKDLLNLEPPLENAGHTPVIC